MIYQHLNWTGLILLLALWMGLPLVASAQEAAPTSPFEASEERVLSQSKTYLEALKLNDLNTAYLMETGSLDGSLTPLRFRESAFQGGRALLNYQITSVTLESGHALVIADIGIAVPPMRTPYQTKIRLKWVMREGKLMRETPPPIDKSRYQPILQPEKKADEK